MGLPAFPVNREPETAVAAYLCDGCPVFGSIQRATTFTPCMGWMAFPAESVNHTEPWMRAVAAENNCLPLKLD